jgi:two-component system nitrate/nitrite response regulator NarL
LTSLTERERQIMRVVCEGHSNKEVARRLSVSEGTVKVHLHHVFEKLAIRNRTALVAYQFKNTTTNLRALGDRPNKIVAAPTAWPALTP